MKAHLHYDPENFNHSCLSAVLVILFKGNIELHKVSESNELKFISGDNQILNSQYGVIKLVNELLELRLFGNNIKQEAIINEIIGNCNDINSRIQQGRKEQAQAKLKNAQKLWEENQSYYWVSQSFNYAQLVLFQLSFSVQQKNPDVYCRYSLFNSVRRHILDKCEGFKQPISQVIQESNHKDLELYPQIQPQIDSKQEAEKKSQQPSEAPVQKKQESSQKIKAQNQAQAQDQSQKKDEVQQPVKETNEASVSEEPAPEPKEQKVEQKQKSNEQKSNQQKPIKQNTKIQQKKSDKKQELKVQKVQSPSAEKSNNNKQSDKTSVTKQKQSSDKQQLEQTKTKSKLGPKQQMETTGPGKSKEQQIQPDNNNCKCEIY